ncbi:hypothetical protein H0X09_01320 [Candidatus Saccharibacteria bacterium]|nr:hypothetical protein [Candidatus Saccharibacteria bacterium]
MAKKSRSRKFQGRSNSFTQKSRFFIPWPYIFFLLLCSGVLLVGWTFKITAQNIVVSAKVPAAVLTEPAVITNPVNGQRFTSYPIPVSGTCPLNSYVKLYRNDVFSGTAICSASQTFSLSSDLFSGANEFKARVFNTTDDEGPQSNTVTVYLDPVPAEPGAPKPPPSTSSSPLIIKTDFRFVGYYTGQTGRWKLEISGGAPPYAVNVDWGDGTSSIFSRKKSGDLIIQHKYEKAGPGENSSYTVKVTGSDSDDNKAYLEFFVIVNSNNLPELVGDTIPTARPPVDTRLLWLLWPAYIVVILMVVSFYLGEREELLELRKRGALRRRRA